MANATHILAIDQGTTSTRAVVFDTLGRVQATAQIPLKQIYPANGWVEHDPEEIWAAVASVCRTVISDTSTPSSVAAIGITNQRETTVVWDRRTGDPISNAIVWQDRRGAARCDELKASGAEQIIQSKTGLLLDSYFSATKIQWILENVDGARASANAGHLAFGTIDTFLLWRLTEGRCHMTDATNASRTMLFNIHNGGWDDELLSLFDIPKSILPQVGDTAGPFGHTQSVISDNEIPITGLVGDQQGALVGQACFAPGMIKATYGTGCFVLANTGSDAPVSTNRLLTTVAYKIDGTITYAMEGSIFNAGTVIQWLRDNVGLINDAAESETLASSTDDVESIKRVFMVPAFTGLGAPHWDPEARGAILGLTRDTGAAEIVRAGLESVCFQTSDLLSALKDDGIPAPTALRVDGGMTANTWLLQSLADICAVPVERPSYTETTVLGAAFLAGLGHGLYASLDEIETVLSLDFCATPKMPHRQRTDLLDGWKDAIARVRSHR